MCYFYIYLYTIYNLDFSQTTEWNVWNRVKRRKLFITIITINVVQKEDVNLKFYNVIENNIEIVFYMTHKFNIACIFFNRF